MSDSIDWQLILGCLGNSLNRDAEHKFNQWLTESATNRANFERIKNIWETAEIPLPEPHIHKALETVKRRIAIGESSAGRVDQIASQEKERAAGWQIFSYKFLRVAAVLLLFVLSAYWIYHISFIKELKPNEIVVAYAQKKSIDLPDGTKIILDAGTKLRYPVDFNDSSRQLYLNGEAFFDVVSNPQKPFIVQCSHAVVTVIGTRFNIRSWKKYDKVEVAVAEGRVSLKSKNNLNKKAQVVITKGKMSELKRSGLPTTPQTTDIQSHISWLKREKYFKNVPLQEVLDQIERWYNVECELQDESYASNLTNIFIANEPVENVLEVIALMNDFEYKRHGNKIKFILKK